MVTSIRFQTFLYRHLKLSKTWKFTMLLLYIAEQLQQQLEYTLLKPDRHCWGISKMQSGREEERYAIKFCFKLGKMPQKRMECFRLLLEHLAWIEHQFLSGIRDSRKAGNLWGMMRGVAGVRKSEHQSWLARGLGLRLVCWGFKGVQEEIHWEAEQHSSNRVSGISSRTIHQSTAPSLSQTKWARWAWRQFLTLPIVETLLPVTFGYSLSSEAVVCYETIEMKKAVTKVIDTLTQEDFHGALQKLLERYNKCIAAGGDYLEED